MREVKWVWCDLCGRATLICWKCGNNLCNGGTRPDCPDRCLAATRYQDLARRNNSVPTKEQCSKSPELPEHEQRLISAIFRS